LAFLAAIALALPRDGSHPVDCDPEPNPSVGRGPGPGRSSGSAWRGWWGGPPVDSR